MTYFITLKLRLEYFFLITTDIKPLHEWYKAVIYIRPRCLSDISTLGFMYRLYTSVTVYNPYLFVTSKLFCYCWNYSSFYFILFYKYKYNNCKYLQK